MSSCEIQWKHSAEKDLRGIYRQFITRILEAIDSLSDNPFPSQQLGDLNVY
jgi:hypothetical protein